MDLFIFLRNNVPDDLDIIFEYLFVYSIVKPDFDFCFPSIKNSKLINFVCFKPFPVCNNTFSVFIQ